jgi:hypothetical protein
METERATETCEFRRGGARPERSGQVFITRGRRTPRAGSAAARGEGRSNVSAKKRLDEHPIELLLLKHIC